MVMLAQMPARAFFTGRGRQPSLPGVCGKRHESLRHAEGGDSRRHESKEFPPLLPSQALQLRLSPSEVGAGSEEAAGREPAHAPAQAPNYRQRDIRNPVPRRPAQSQRIVAPSPLPRHQAEAYAACALVAEAR